MAGFEHNPRTFQVAADLMILNRKNPLFKNVKLFK
jgi:hypothetical protein